jgi:predicted small lipoprotein YifL
MRNTSILLIAALLVACGQRGALYLPGAQKEQVSAPAATPAAPAATEPTTPATDEAAERERQQRARTN